MAAIHASGLAHRDLKTENMFLDNEFNIKIGDFGFAKFLDGENKGRFTSHLGTPGYQSPQMLICKNYNGFENDIFACGVILFVIHAGSPPFREAKETDPWYKNFLNKHPHIFWQYHLKNKKFSNNFIKLITGMLSPEGRYTIKDVINSDWYKEELATKDEVKKEMEERKVIVKKAREKENLQIEIDSDESQESDKKYRDIGSDTLLEQLNNLEVDDDLIVEWEPNEYESGNFIKVNVPHKKIFCEIAYSLTMKYEGVSLDINNEKLSMIVKYEDLNLNAETDLDKISINNISAIDINLQVFKTDGGSVVQFFKNEAMSQFDYRNLYQAIRQVLKKD